MQMVHRYITISVDDGYPADPKAADLLQKYNLQATFYLPARNPEYPVMTSAEIRSIAQRFEIGSHTYSHVPLAGLSNGHAWNEIVDGKQWLEQLLGSSVTSFCYPRGKFNRATTVLVKRAGFLGARTCLFNLHEFPKDPFRWGLSTHAAYHTIAIHLRHALLEGNFVGMRNFFACYDAATDWEAHFRRALSQVQEHGGIAHLYLHSWEIEQFGEWGKLEAVLKSVSNWDLKPVTNGQLFALWRQLAN
jgi:peptidoglycan-N-acetylglucosamine deacetylase